MPCIELESASDTLVAFSVTYSLNSTMQASVTVVDPNCDSGIAQVTCNDLGTATPIQVKLGAAITNSCGDCPDLSGDGCFAEDPYWVSGLVGRRRIDGDYFGMPTVTYEVVPYSEYLSNKPIHTQVFKNSLTSTVLLEIANYYAGIPAGVRDFNPINNRITGPVVGNSTLEELKKLAAAGYSHLFTQVGGKLTIEQWKTINDPVDYILPNSLIYDIRREPIYPSRVSIIRARGAGISKYDCGEQAFTDIRADETNPGAYSGVGGTLQSCSVSGISTPELELNLNNLSADKDDLKNAKLASDVIEVEEFVEAEDGTFKVKIVKLDGSWFDDNATDYKVQVYGKKRPDYESNSVGSQVRPSQQYTSSTFDVMHNQWARVAPFPVPPSSFFRSLSKLGEAAPSQTADADSIERIETLVYDARISSFGIQSEQLDNPYSHVKEHLFLQGVRRFQEIRMAESTYVIEMAYMPCLKLNQVIQFYDSQNYGCGKAGVITGIIAGITVNYSLTSEGAPNVKMTLTIWGLDCTGATIYTSDNLLINRCAGSDGSVSNPWTTSILGLDSEAAFDGGCGFLYTVGFPSIAWFRYTHDEFVVGDAYTVSFDFTRYAGSGNFVFTYPGGSIALGGTSTYSIPFAPLSAIGYFEWNLSNTFVPTAYTICNVKLTKTVTA